MQKTENIKLGMAWHGKTPKGWVEANRKIYDYELVYFACGCCRTITENRTIICDEGTLLIIPPDYEYVCIAETDADRWCIHFDWYGDCPAYVNGDNIQVVVDKKHIFNPALAAGRIPENVMKFPVLVKLSTAEAIHIQSLLQTFFNIYQDKPALRILKLGIFLQLLGSVLGSSGLNIPNDRKEHNTTFVYAKRLIDQSFDDPDLELRAIANELRITPNHLNKLFKSHLALSPNAYLQNQRLNHAISLLSSTRLSISEIAEASGFATANYFIRCFKAKNKITPQKYREETIAAKDADFIEINSSKHLQTETNHIPEDD